MKTVMMDNRVWFWFEQEEIVDLVIGLISAKEEDEVHLREYSDILEISRQMELRRNINRYQALIEQLSQGRAY